MRYFSVVFFVGCLFFGSLKAQCPLGSRVTASAVVTDVRCNQGSDGAITAVVSEGVAPFSYNWSNGRTTATISNISSGIYSATVTDSLGCSTVLSNIGVKQPGAFIYNVVIHNVSCFGGSDGSLNFSLSGGTPPYSYVWTNVTTNTVIATTEDVSNLPLGIYGLVITDANGCRGGIFYLMAQAAEMNVQATVTNVTCPGGNDGSIVLTVTGGTGTKNYLWSTRETSKNISNKPAGTYTVTVTDVNGCTVANAFSISEPAPLDAIASVTDISCLGERDGAIDITATGGTSPYVFIWSNAETTEDITNLSVGQYCVTITDSKNCVSDPICFTVNEPTEISISADITNVSCLGSADGAIDITVAGGNPPYTYGWTGGETTEDINGLSPGIYTIIVTDVNGCTMDETFAVRTENILILSTGITQPLCNEPNGSATVTISGGIAPFIIQWSNGLTGATIDGLGAGSYGVTVTDASGCSASAVADISNVSTLSAPGDVTNTICGSGNIGSISITVTGGNGPYTFNWSNGALTNFISGLGAGTYSVTVTDSVGCAAATTFSVEEESGLSISAAATSPDCDQSNGSIDLTVAGGTPPYSYSWSSGQFSSSISGLESGVYVVTVTDSSGCDETQIIVLRDVAGPQISINKTDITCDNLTGTLEVVINSGTGPFTILWTTGDTTATITGLEPGIYAVEVTDSSGCSSLDFEILLPALGIVIEAAMTEPTCNGSSDASIDVTVIQGTAPFTFQWSTGANSEDISGISAGTYDVTVTDAGGCSATTRIVIDEPEEITATADTLDQIMCNGDSTGSIGIAVTGGTAPYTYDWSNGDTTEDIANLAAGQYCVTITDSKNCVSDPICFTVNEPNEISISADITNVSCPGSADGAIDITVTGGSPPYTYGWTGGSTTEDLSGLTPGIYSVIVTDASGCTMNGTFTVRTENLVILSVGITQPLCGESNGSATVTVSGGNPPFVIQWSNGQGGATINNLGAGSYGVTVTDANGCSSSATADISNVNDLSITGNVTNTVCGINNSGAIDITVSGGTAPYASSWSNGAITEDISGLSEGSYSVTVTDSSGCQAVMTFNVIEESGLNISASTTPPNCGQADGSILLTVTGGTPPYSYSWSSGQSSSSITGVGSGVYMVTVTDSVGCEETQIVVLQETAGPQISINKTDITCDNPAGTLEVVIASGTGPFTIIWTTGDTTATITGLEPGLYAVEVTDSSGCSALDFAVLTPSLGIVIEAAMTEPTCNGSSDASIDVMVIQGTAPFTFQWSTGANSEDISGISAGTYDVTVTDAGGCSATTTIVIDEPEEITATEDSLDQPKCGGDSTGTISIIVAGGNAPYSYNWSNGDTTEDLSNVPAGEYCVVITDAHGCVSDTFCFTLNEPTPIQIQSSITQPTCNGDENGSISATVSGGTEPYTFEWSTGDTTPNISGLAAGNYTLTATDLNGCTAEGNFTVNEPDSLIVNILDSSDVKCNGANDGSITAQVSGGTPLYNYQWSNGGSTQSLSGLAPGSYQVTVVDENGCRDSSDVVTITEPDSLLVIGNIVQPVCSLSGRIDVIVSGGTLPYDYEWSTGADSSSLIGIGGGGVFDVTVTDANGCSASASFTVSEPPVMDVLIEVTQQLRCNGDTSGELCARVDGVPGPYFYEWSTGDVTECISGLPAGTYSVTVANGSGCSAYENGFILNQPDQISISPTIDSVNCFGGNDGQVRVSVSGGTPPYSYQWSNGDTGNQADNLPAGPVSVTVTDSNACSATMSIDVPQPVALNFDDSEVNNTTCDTTTDGSISLTITGGTLPYTFLWDNGLTGSLRENLAEGSYTVTVTDAHGCSDSTSFTIDGPSCNLPPVALDDTSRLFVCKNDSVDIAVLENDYDPDGDDIYVSAILDAPLHGTVQVNSDWTITYVPAPGYIGIDTFTYIICEVLTQPSLCDSAVVIIAVLPCRPNITIPTGFSPNGDGVNDGFDIPGIDFFPDNKLLIFNRWGNKVKEFNGYRNEWTGNNADNEPLPDGTYYFILELHNDSNTTYTGYVVIQR